MPRSRPTYALAFVALLVQLAVGAGAIAPAAAAVSGADDRQLSTATAWWTYTGVTASQVDSLATANGARVTDISVDSTTPTFTVVMVRNSGAYASGWWWFYGKTPSQVSSLLASNNARLVSIDAYSTSSGVRFAVAMVPNTGASATSWWWYYDIAPADVSAQLSSHSARLVQLTPYPGTGRYVAVMVDNTGTSARKWWWYHGRTANQVTSATTTNHARLVDLSRNDDGTWNAVMYGNGAGTRWYWYYGQNLATAVRRAAQQGERIIDVTRYGSSYAVLETRNTNATTEKLWQVISPTVDSGSYGFYLKRVGGSVVADLLSTKQYEPASALEVLYHAKSIHEESLGHMNDATSVTYHFHDQSDPADGAICPDDYNTTAVTNLKNADTLMMQSSDNRMARAILERYTQSSVLSYATSLGLTSTTINHNIGCPTPTTHNESTLADLGKVYEQFQTGVVTSNATWQSQFRSRMLNQGNYPGFHSTICPVVDQEAFALGKSSVTAVAFCDALTWVAKGGSYRYGPAVPYRVSRTGLSLTGVPYKSSGVTTPRYFVWGEFVDGATIDSSSESTTLDDARAKLYQEALRPYIRAALRTW